jgi:predicted nucleic acid-binding protein
VILLDTTPIVALCDPRDRLNRRALVDLDRLVKSPLIVCSPVLTEACFHLPHRSQRERLQRFLTDFAVENHRLGEDVAFRDQVFAWLHRYADQEPDWADGYLAVAAARDRTARVWTYDREFRTVWRRPDGTRIPLAVSDLSA